jgi:hypothetical protein
MLDGPTATYPRCFPVSLPVYGADIVTQERTTFDPVTHRTEIYRPAFEPR